MLSLPCRLFSLILSLLLFGFPAFAADLPPMVTSYAEKPVQGFNLEVQQAIKQHQTWVNKPETISRHYAGEQFKLMRTVPRGNVSVSYLTKVDGHHSKQVLMILMLEKQGKSWKLQKAMVSWQCKKGQHFSTDPCH